MSALFEIETGQPPVGPGNAREDGVPDDTVTIRIQDPTVKTAQVLLDWVPPNDEDVLATLTQVDPLDPLVWQFTPTATHVQAAGTYLVHVITDASNPTRRDEALLSYVILTPNSGLVIPALNEPGNPLASLNRPDSPGAANNVPFPGPGGPLSPIETINFAGWWHMLHKLILNVDAFASGAGFDNVAVDVGAGTGRLAGMNNSVAEIPIRSLVQTNDMVITTVTTNPDVDEHVEISGELLLDLTAVRPVVGPAPLTLKYAQGARLRFIDDSEPDFAWDFRVFDDSPRLVIGAITDAGGNFTEAITIEQGASQAIDIIRLDGNSLRLFAENGHAILNSVAGGVRISTGNTGPSPTDLDVILDSEEDVLILADTIQVNLGQDNLAIGATSDVLFNSQNTTASDAAPILRLRTNGANAATVRMFVGPQDPNASIDGLAGDLYFRADGVSSSVYQNTDGAQAWNDLGAGGGGPPAGAINEAIVNSGAGGFLSHDRILLDQTGNDAALRMQPEATSSGDVAIFMSDESGGLRLAFLWDSSESHTAIVSIQNDLDLIADFADNGSVVVVRATDRTGTVDDRAILRLDSVSTSEGTLGAVSDIHVGSRTSTPQNFVTAAPGTLYVRVDGTDSDLYIKTSAGVDDQNWTSLRGVTAPLQSDNIRADTMEFASTDWTGAVLVPGTLVVHSGSPFMVVAAFDDTTSEGMGKTVFVPNGATNVTFSFTSSGSGTTGTVTVEAYGSDMLGAAPSFTGPIAVGAPVFPTNDNMQRDSFTLVGGVAALGLTAGQSGKIQIARVSGGMSGDWQLENIGVSFS